MPLLSTYVMNLILMMVLHHNSAYEAEKKKVYRAAQLAAPLIHQFYQPANIVYIQFKQCLQEIAALWKENPEVTQFEKQTLIEQYQQFSKGLNLDSQKIPLLTGHSYSAANCPELMEKMNSVNAVGDANFNSEFVHPHYQAFRAVKYQFGQEYQAEDYLRRVLQNRPYSSQLGAKVQLPFSLQELCAVLKSQGVAADHVKSPFAQEVYDFFSN